MEHLTILDFNTGDVDIYPIDSDFNPAYAEALIGNLGHRVSDCEWMLGTGNITFHKEVLK